MEVSSAIDLVNALVFIPNWRISATDHTNRFEGTILVRIDYPARNSNRDQASGNYPQEIMTYATFPIVVGDCEDDCDLYGLVADAVAEIQLHEIREFLRVQPTYWAPFHPHKIDGMKRWNRRRRDHDILLRDLQFGLA